MYVYSSRPLYHNAARQGQELQVHHHVFQVKLELGKLRLTFHANRSHFPHEFAPPPRVLAGWTLTTISHDRTTLTDKRPIDTSQSHNPLSSKWTLPSELRSSAAMMLSEEHTD
jgi:hypothetical protein